MKIRKGDMVKVIAGKDKGKTARVLRVYLKENQVLLERSNLVKRHQKPNQQFRQGGIIEKEMPIHVSNIMYYDEKSAKASRLGARIVGDKKVRHSKKIGEIAVNQK